jgi:hypothetical protein
VTKVGRPLTALLVTLALGACSGPSALSDKPGLDTTVTTDDRFRIEWSPAQSKQGRPLIAGYITNTRGNGVTNLRVQAQTLDAQGQVTDTASALAPGYVGGFGRIYFEVPLEKTGASYRVNMVSWDLIGGGA